jgi:hypothetical protein
MEKLLEDLAPSGSIYDKLLWYDNLTRRYYEFDWPKEYPHSLCQDVFKDILSILNTKQYTSGEWLNYMKVLDRIQCTSEKYIQACVQAMLTNPNGTKTLTVEPRDVREFLSMYPDRNNLPILRFFILQNLQDVYRKLVLYTIKQEFPIRCYLQSISSTPSPETVADCTINYDDPAFELDMLYLNFINA